MRFPRKYDPPGTHFQQDAIVAIQTRPSMGYMLTQVLYRERSLISRH